MKILQVMAGGKHGGAETAFVDMCIALHEAGEDIEVITRPNALRVPALERAGIKVHTLPFGGRADIYTPWRIRKIIQKFKPAIVQTWMSRAADKVPAWHESMGIDRYKVVSRLGSPYKIKYFKNADHFVTITPDIKTYLIQNGIEARRVTHINNFADMPPAFTKVSRATFGTPENVPLLLGLGRLHPSKAFDTLIKAAADMPDVHVWIAGEGPERPALERLIKDLGLTDRVKLIGWQSDRTALFALCDICTFISRVEPFGTVFVQAWAAKVPVIVSKADGPRQFVRHGEDGLMIDIDDVPALQSCIRSLLDDPALAQKLVQNGFARYESEFTKNACLRAYLECYSQTSLS